MADHKFVNLKYSDKSILKSGTCYFGDMETSFTVRNVAEKRNYDYEISVKLINPETNGIFCSPKRYTEKKDAGKLSSKDEKAYKEGKAVESLYAEKVVYLKHGTNDDIKKKVVIASSKLSTKYGEEIKSIRKKLDPEEAVIFSPSTLYNARKSEFMAAHRTWKEEKTKERKDSYVTEVLALFGAKPIEQITQRDVKAVFGNLGGRDKVKKEKLNLAAEFLEFCRSNKYIRLNSNPIADFVSGQVTTNTKQQSATKKLPHYLNKRTECALYKFVMDELDESLSLAIPLIIGAGLKIPELIELKWADIEIIDGIVFVKSYNNENAGHTHNFTRPLLKSWSLPVQTKKEMLLQRGISEGELNRKPVLEFEGKTTAQKEKSGALTRYIRETLQVEAKMRTLCDGSKNTAPGGQGYKLLMNQRNYILNTVCSIPPKSGEANFLNGESPASVTDDVYREYEKEYLTRLVKLDNRNLSEEAGSENYMEEEKKKKGIVTYHSKGGGDCMKNCIAAEGIFLPPGTIIKARGKAGACGYIECARRVHDKSKQIVHEIY